MQIHRHRLNTIKTTEKLHDRNTKNEYMKIEEHKNKSQSRHVQPKLNWNLKHKREKQTMNAIIINQTINKGHY